MLTLKHRKSSTQQHSGTTSSSSSSSSASSCVVGRPCMAPSEQWPAERASRAASLFAAAPLFAQSLLGPPITQTVTRRNSKQQGRRME